MMEKDHYKEPRVDGRIILKWILNVMAECGINSYGSE
jgi:hypothetical protein